MNKIVENAQRFKPNYSHENKSVIEKQITRQLQILILHGVYFGKRVKQVGTNRNENSVLQICSMACGYTCPRSERATTILSKRFTQTLKFAQQRLTEFRQYVLS